MALAEAEAARAAQNEELVALRKQETSLRERLAGLTESVHGLELQIHEKKLHLHSLLERVSSELSLDEDILVAEYGPDQLVPRDPGVEPLRTNCSTTRRSRSIVVSSSAGWPRPSGSSPSWAASIRSLWRSSPRSSSATPS